jgi:hypothetical protein
VVPPAVLEFRKWLTIWSGESAKLQDANEKERHAAILEGGLKPKPIQQPYDPRMPKYEYGPKRKYCMMKPDWKVAQENQLK